MSPTTSTSMKTVMSVVNEHLVSMIIKSEPAIRNSVGISTIKRQSGNNLPTVAPLKMPAFRRISGMLS